MYAIVYIVLRCWLLLVLPPIHCLFEGDGGDVQQGLHLLRQSGAGAALQVAANITKALFISVFQ